VFVLLRSFQESTNVAGPAWGRRCAIVNADANLYRRYLVEPPQLHGAAGARIVVLRLPELEE